MVPKAPAVLMHSQARLATPVVQARRAPAVAQPKPALAPPPVRFRPPPVAAPPVPSALIQAKMAIAPPPVRFRAQPTAMVQPKAKPPVRQGMVAPPPRFRNYAIAAPTTGAVAQPKALTIAPPPVRFRNQPTPAVGRPVIVPQTPPAVVASQTSLTQRFAVAQLKAVSTASIQKSAVVGPPKPHIAAPAGQLSVPMNSRPAVIQRKFIKSENEKGIFHWVPDGSGTGTAGTGRYRLILNSNRKLYLDLSKVGDVDLNSVDEGTVGDLLTSGAIVGSRGRGAEPPTVDQLDLGEAASIVFMLRGNRTARNKSGGDIGKMDFRFSPAQGELFFSGELPVIRTRYPLVNFTPVSSEVLERIRRHAWEREPPHYHERFANEPWVYIREQAEITMPPRKEKSKFVWGTGNDFRSSDRDDLTLEIRRYILETVHRLRPPSVTPAIQVTAELSAKDRDAGQDVAMGNINAAAYALAYGESNADQTDWEWLHIRGARLGGRTTSENLVCGTTACNSQMIPIENALLALSKLASRAQPLWIRWEGQTVGSSRMGKWIKIEVWAPNGLDNGTNQVLPVDAHLRWVFDPRTGAIFDRLDRDLAWGVRGVQSRVTGYRELEFGIPHPLESTFRIPPGFLSPPSTTTDIVPFGGSGTPVSHAPLIGELSVPPEFLRMLGRVTPMQRLVFLNRLNHRLNKPSIAVQFDLDDGSQTFIFGDQPSVVFGPIRNKRNRSYNVSVYDMCSSPLRFKHRRIKGPTSGSLMSSSSTDESIVPFSGLPSCSPSLFSLLSASFNNAMRMIDHPQAINDREIRIDGRWHSIVEVTGDENYCFFRALDVLGRRTSRTEVVRLLRERGYEEVATAVELPSSAVQVDHLQAIATVLGVRIRVYHAGWGQSEWHVAETYGTGGPLVHLLIRSVGNELAAHFDAIRYR
jgi:hypothetical protein